MAVKWRLTTLGILVMGFTVGTGGEFPRDSAASAVSEIEASSSDRGPDSSHSLSTK